MKQVGCKKRKTHAEFVNKQIRASILCIYIGEENPSYLHIASQQKFFVDDGSVEVCPRNSYLFLSYIKPIVSIIKPVYIL